MRAFVLRGPGDAVLPRSPRTVSRPRRGRRRRRAGRRLRHRRGVLHRRDGLPADRPGRLSRSGSGTSGAAPGFRGGDGRRPGLARPARHRRHHAGLRPVPSVHHRAPARLRRPVRGRDPRAAGPARWPSSSGCRSASLHVLPDGLDPALGALVEPGGNAWRAAEAAARPGGRAARDRAGDDRPAGGDVRAGDGARCTCSVAAGALTSPAPRLRARLDPADAAGSAVRRGHRRLERRRAHRPWRWTWSSRRAGRATSAWPAAPSLIDTRVARAQGRHGGRASCRASPALGATIDGYASRLIDPPTAGRRHGRPGRRRGRARPAAARRRGSRSEDPRRPATLRSAAG